MASDPRAWLTEQGFDPDGDLCAELRWPNGPKRACWVTATAMCEASFAGELGVRQWLVENGAASTIRIKIGDGSAPMMRACCEGHLSSTCL